MARRIRQNREQVRQRLRANLIDLGAHAQSIDDVTDLLEARAALKKTTMLTTLIFSDLTLYLTLEGVVDS